MVNRGDGASRARDARSARRPTPPASPRTVLEACREAGRGSATKQVAREDSEREAHHDFLHARSVYAHGSGCTQKGVSRTPPHLRLSLAFYTT